MYIHRIIYLLYIYIHVYKQILKHQSSFQSSLQERFLSFRLGSMDHQLANEEYQAEGLPKNTMDDELILHSTTRFCWGLEFGWSKDDGTIKPHLVGFPSPGPKWWQECDTGGMLGMFMECFCDIGIKTISGGAFMMPCLVGFFQKSTAVSHIIWSNILCRSNFGFGSRQRMSPFETPGDHFSRKMVESKHEHPDDQQQGTPSKYLCY